MCRKFEENVFKKWRLLLSFFYFVIFLQVERLKTEGYKEKEYIHVKSRCLNLQWKFQKLMYNKRSYQ